MIGAYVFLASSRRLFSVKVFIDQFIQAPILLVFIIIFMGIMEGEGFGTLKLDMDLEYKKTLIANCKSFIHYLLVSAKVSLHLTSLRCYNRETLDSRHYCKHCLCQADPSRSL
jgi:hypothetical protein